MDAIECIATRRSIRKFMQVDVPMELVGRIIDAGRYAPSSGNIQSWRFIIVKDVRTSCSFIFVAGSKGQLLSKYVVSGNKLYIIWNFLFFDG